MQFYLVTLGDFSLRASAADGQVVIGPSKPLSLVALLATLPGATARRDHLAELLWPDADLKRARGSLRQALFSLSQTTAVPLLDAEGGTVSIDTDRVACDLWEFEHALEAEDYAAAMELYGGPFLQGFERKLGREAEHWIESQNERLRAGVQIACTRLVNRALAAGDAEEAVRHARAYVELNPLDEDAQITLIQALKAAGDDAGALQSYLAYRTLLKQELEGEPSTGFAETAERIREAVLRVEPEETPLAEVPRVATPDDVSDAVRRTQARHRRFGALKPVAIGAATGLTVAAAILVTSGLWRTARFHDPLGDLQGRLLIVRESAPDRMVQVRTDGRGIEVRETPFRAADRPAPDGHAIATARTGSNGRGLALRDPATGAIEPLDRVPGDAYPLDWSPDARYLLFAYRRSTGDAADTFHRIGVYDLDRREWRPLCEVESRGIPDAAWSPDGTRIAFAADPDGRPGVFIVRFDGSELHQLSGAAGRSRNPSWSPDGERIAFTSYRNGHADVYTVRPDGSELRRITDAPSDETHPAWLSPSAIAYRSDLGGDRDIWSIDTNTGHTHRLARLGDVSAIIRGYAREGAADWLEALVIQPRFSQVSPGQHIPLEVARFDRAGVPVGGSAPVSWELSDPTIADLIDGPVLRIQAHGRVRLVASAGGWRADTLEIISIPLRRRSLPAAFHESWDDGWRRRWRTIGAPAPYRLPEGPSGGRAFVNNGDRSESSGAITRESFPLGHGLTIESWGRMPFTGRHHETFTLRLYREPPSEPAAGFTDEGLVAALWIQGPVPGRLTPLAHLLTATGWIDLPVPDSLEDWRRYALQIEPDGSLGLVIDDRLHWRSPDPIPLSGTRRILVGLGDSSYDTEITHGPVTVYTGLRYVLPAPAAPASDRSLRGP